MKRLKWAAFAAFMAFAVASCESPQVFQGTVVSYDAIAKQVVIKNEAAPNQEMLFSLEGADIGAEPGVGDLVRVAYKEEAGQNKVGRLMNLAKQDELKKSGGGH
jgi:hypothetical protein